MKKCSKKEAKLLREIANVLQPTVIKLVYEAYQHGRLDGTNTYEKIDKKIKNGFKEHWWGFEQTFGKCEMQRIIDKSRLEGIAEIQNYMKLKWINKLCEEMGIEVENHKTLHDIFKEINEKS